jgi:hypothetical protein
MDAATLTATYGAAGITILILLAGLKWALGEIRRKDDKLMEMLPALTQANLTMANVNEVSTQLLQTLAVRRDRGE